jgi:DNA modification methylase
LRQDIIWQQTKSNARKCHRTDVPKHMSIFFCLVNQLKYYYDNEAIKEDSAESSKDRLNQDIKNQKGSSRVPGKTNGTMNAVGGEKRNKRSVWAVATQSYSEAHFATYPPELIKPCILAGCPEGGTVLDPFGGSGTTAQVASNLNRNAILCELNPEYVEIAKGRLHDSLGMFLDMTVETPQH